MLRPEQIRAIYDAHERYWGDRREEMRLLKSLYMTDFWRESERGTGIGPSMWGWMTSGRTERPKGFKVVESHVGSLFAKNPAVDVGPDIRARGNPEVAQATANLWLEDTFDAFENLTRLALIFPCAFLKLSPAPSPDPLKRVSAAAVPPWEVIVDESATSWDQQRWVGHVFQMPVAEAMATYKRKRQSFTLRRRTDYTEDSRTSDDGEATGEDLDQVIRVVELYDLEDDKLLVWSPDFQSGDEYLFRGVRVEVGGLDPDAGPGTPDEEVEPREEVEYTGIPYKSASGRPAPPIIPMYLARDPEVPLRGYSMLWRIRDLLREDAVNATRLSQGVRKSARQLATPKGIIDEQTASKIAQGIDGEIIEVDVPMGVDPGSIMAPIQWPPTPAEVWEYNMQISADIDDAGLLAPFTRGEATGTTATEQTLLASYTASDIGRMARVRDATIADAARTYNIMLSVALGDDVEPLKLPEPVGQVMLSAQDLTGDFRYIAVDGGSTPLSDAAKKAELLTLIPLLQQLGAPASALVEHIVRTFGLPETFVTVAAPQAPGATPGAPGELSTDMSAPTGEVP